MDKERVLVSWSGAAGGARCLLIIDDKVESDAGPARPLRVRRSPTVSDQVALVLWRNRARRGVRRRVVLRVVDARARGCR